MKPDFISADKYQVYIHANGTRYAIKEHLEILNDYTLEIEKNGLVGHIVESSMKKISVPEYIKARQENKKQFAKNVSYDEAGEPVRAYATEEFFDFPRHKSPEFQSKLMYDMGMKYSYNYDMLYYDIEAAKTNDEFPDFKNQSAFVTVITLCHVKKDEQPKCILLTL